MGHSRHKRSKKKKKKKKKKSHRHRSSSKKHKRRGRHRDRDSPTDSNSPSEDQTDIDEKLAGRKGRRVTEHTDLAVLADAKRLWLEYSRGNVGAYANSGYEYNVFDAKKHRILVAMPVKDTNDGARETDKPKAYSINTSSGEELFDFKFTTGSCIKRAIQINIEINKQSAGSIQQIGKKIAVNEAGGAELMYMMGVPLLGCCNQTGPDHFKSDVFIPQLGPKVPVGVIGRNGVIMEHVVVGEPSGFFFLEGHGSEIHGRHKVFILAVLVVLMTMCKFIFFKFTTNIINIKNY